MNRKWKALVAAVLIGSLTLDWQEPGLTVAIAQSQTPGILNISWTPPTEYTDNAPLLEQDLDFYTFYCDTVSVAQIDSVIGDRTAQISTASLSAGDHECWLTVTTLSASESGPSNSVNFTIGPRVPMAPAGLSLT